MSIISAHELQALSTSSCCSKQEKPVSANPQAPSAVPPAVRAWAARAPNLEKLYQLPAEQRDIALKNLFEKILVRLIKRSDVSNERMMHALGFDRPMLAQWIREAKEKTAAQKFQ
jgi:hypothetical protein